MSTHSISFEDAVNFFYRDSQRLWASLLATEVYSALRSSLWSWYVGESGVVYIYR